MPSNPEGNVTDNGPLSFVYDLSDQPTSLSGDDTGSFVYDGNYKRVKQTINGETIYTVYNQAGEVAYRDNVTTGEATNYVRMGGRTVVRFKTGGTGGPETAYLHADHLGSPVAATDETGAILWAEHFTPYGENIPGPAANTDDEGFTGHIQDTDTGLTYMQARYYDPVIGRFLSNDPVGFADERNPAFFNRYAYTQNDPVNNIDPTGMCSESSSGSDTICNTEDAISNFLEPIIENVMEAMGVDVVTEGERDPNGEFGHEGPGNTPIEEAGAITEAIVDAGMGRIIPGGRRKRCCFVAGTLVDTKDGLRPIEEIAVGDEVWARDTETGHTSLKPVTHLIRRHERTIWEVVLTGLDGAAEHFETTDDHPWWIAGQGWKTTEELETGMAIVTRDGRGMTLVSVTETERTDATYNLTVADFSTYFVGEQRVLVHNCNEQDRQRQQEQRERRNQRREDRSRATNGQNRSGEGFRDHESANRGPSGTRPSGPNRRNNRERNRGIDEEHSRVPKGPRRP